MTTTSPSTRQPDGDRTASYNNNSRYLILSLLLTITIAISASLLAKSHALATNISINSLAKYAAVFVLGALSPLLIKRLITRLVSKSASQAAADSKLYNLRHGVLNIRTDTTQMWMNMGYWKDQSLPTNLPRACEALLKEVLGVAGLVKSGSGLREDGMGKEKFNVLDVGFGCGDQAMALLKMENVAAYVGVTVDEQQFEFAERRLANAGLLSKSFPVGDGKGTGHVTRQVFRADGAKPAHWSRELKAALHDSFVPGDGDERYSNWVLSLDVLYHLSPSRSELFKYANQSLHASIMAFDLLLPDPKLRTLSLLEQCLLRIVAALTSTPYTNFLTPLQYRQQLVDAGYSDEDIEIRDISELVFAPLVAFLEWQDAQLKSFGLSIGPFRAAGWIFSWWARTGIVRGCIIVARRSDSS